MTGNEIDWGAVLTGLALLLGGLGYYLKASGKWREFQVNRAARNAETDEVERVAEEKRVARLEAQVDRLVAERMEEFRTEVAAREQRITNLETINAEHRQSITVLTETVARLTKDRELYLNSLEALEASLVETNRKYDADRTQWNRTQTSLEHDLEALRSRVASLESELARKTTELDRVRADMKAYEEQMHQMELVNTRLEERNEGLKAANGTLAALVERALSALPPQEPGVLGAKEE